MYNIYRQAYMRDRMKGIKMSKTKKIAVPIIIVAVLALAVVLFLALCTCTVPTGYTGILTTFGRVENETLEAGFHFKSPFQNLTNMDNRTQKFASTDSAFSSDIQQVDINYSVNYNIDKATAMNLYREVGINYFDTLVLPRLSENIKSAFSKYTADSLVKQREVISMDIAEDLKAEMSQFGINIINVNVENIDFTDAFTQAVEAKQVAEQTKLKAEIEEAQKSMEAQKNAERQVIAAEAEAEVAKIQAEAAKYAGEKEAEMNKKLAESLTPELVEYYYSQKWNGQLPSYVGGEATLPILDLTKDTTAPTPAE